MNGVILPRIHRVEFHGFQPLFEKPIKLDLPAGPFLVLGGNGIGKTTMLQAITFGLAGPAGPDIEKDTAYQWDVENLAHKLVAPKNAEIIVEFSMAKNRITVRRGVDTDGIRGLRVNRDDPIDNTQTASQEYENAVTLYGNYPSFDEFRYLMHRLCYLAENRRNLLWDKAAQVRAIMLVCGDAAGEADFRTTRAALQNTDTEKRHLHVDIGRLKSRIEKLEGRPLQVVERKSGDITPAPLLIDEAADLQKELDLVARGRIKLLKRLSRTRKALLILNVNLEHRQEQLGAREDAFVLKTLRKLEDGASALALHKLLVYKRCPYCTQVAEKLARGAQKAITTGNCPICGQPHAAEASSGELAELRGIIMAGTREREKLDRACSNDESLLLDLEQKEMSLRARLSEITLKLPRIPKEDDIELDTKNIASLQKTLQVYEKKHAQLEQRCAELKKSVEEKYANFTASCARRLDQLQKVASEYGQEFLGDPCEFVLVPASGELSAFNYFVPKYADIERKRPDACSESERFFLDIAFRMALVDLAGVLSNTRGTFICETPENALDLAYTDNVAEMFSKFAVREFSILLTANIQLGGVAKPLLGKYPPADRIKRVFNLIEAGVTTQVQQRKEREFSAQFKQLVGQV